MIRAVVEVRRPDGSVERKEFNQGRITIGRDAGDLVLGDPLSSGRHAELTIRPEGVTVADLGSTNGTFLPSGERLLAPTAWGVGTSLRMGTTTLLLLEAGVPQAPQVTQKGTMVMGAAPDPWAATALGSIDPVQLPPAAAPVPYGAPPAAPQPAPAAAAPVPYGAPPAAAQPPYGGPTPAPYGAPPAAAPYGGPTPAPYGAPPAAAPYATAPDPFAAGPSGGYGAPGQGAPGYGAPGQGAPGYGAPGQGAPGYAPPAGYAQVPRGAQPMGATPAAIGPIEFLKETLEAYRPHAAEATKALGLILIPIQIVMSLLGMIPGVGLILAPVLGLFVVLPLHLFLISGVTAEVGLRLTAGIPLVTGEVWQRQKDRMVPWGLALIVPGIIVFLGALCLLVPGVLFGLFLMPVLLVERRGGWDATRRSLELVLADALLAIVPGFLLLLATVIVSAILGALVGWVPVVGPLLAGVTQGIVSAITTPLVSFLIFRTYRVIRQRLEPRSVDEELQTAAHS